MTKQVTLFQKVGAFWTTQQKSGNTGLRLLDECMRHTAKHRDWDALARFVSRSGTDRGKIGLIIKAAFGDTISYQADKKHDAGGRFSLKFEGEYPLDKSNHYGLIRKAVEDGKSFRSADFLKDLREAVGKPDPKPKAYLVQLKDTLKYMQKKIEDFPDLKAVLADPIRNLEQAVKAQEAKAEV